VREKNVAELPTYKGFSRFLLQLSAWLTELKQELVADDDVLAATAAAADGQTGGGPEAAERLLEQFAVNGNGFFNLNPS